MHGCCCLLHAMALQLHGMALTTPVGCMVRRVCCMLHVALNSNSSQVDEFVGYSLRQSASADNGAAHTLLPLRRVMDQRAEVRPFPILSADADLSGNAHHFI